MTNICCRKIILPHWHIGFTFVKNAAFKLPYCKFILAFKDTFEHRQGVKWKWQLWQDFECCGNLLCAEVDNVELEVGCVFWYLCNTRKMLLMYIVTIMNLKQSDSDLEKKNQNNSSMYLEVWICIYRNICIFVSYHIEYQAVSLMLPTYICGTWQK